MHVHLIAPVACFFQLAGFLAVCVRRMLQMSGFDGA